MHAVRRAAGLLICIAWCAAAAAGCASSSSSSSAPLSQATHFDSPQAAAQSLVDALRRDDQASLKKILAPAADDILSSGDKVADRGNVAKFLAMYDAAHRIEPAGEGTSTLVVGKDDWPFPVPIVQMGRKYVFDSEAGRDEILNRRIGRNELSAEQVCLAIADAQRDYVARNPTGSDLPEYARKLVSDPGTKDGLYWPTAASEAPSPLGPLAASAADEGYNVSATTRPSGEPPPAYHGYRYRLLTRQGEHARGGAMDYEVNGRLIGGFAVVAYPADYGNSGIMTFITNHDGVVYQRDLGPDTQKIAEAMTEFDPGPDWKRSDDANTVVQSDD